MEQIRKTQNTKHIYRKYLKPTPISFEEKNKGVKGVVSYIVRWGQKIEDNG